MNLSTLDEASLDCCLQQLLEAALAPSTRMTYRRHQQHFQQFCQRLNYRALPAESVTIARYIAFLSSTQSPQTILCHLSAIRMLHAAHGRATDITSAPLVHYALRGVTRGGISPPRQMKPMTVSLLKRILHLLNFQMHEDRLFWAAALLMFYSLLRRSNALATSNTAPGQHALRRADVNLDLKQVELTIRSSKTARSTQVPQLIVIPARPGHRLCLVGALLVARELAPDAPDTRPFFLWPSGKAYCHRHFMTRLRQLMGTLAEPPKEYGCHSFRRGGATHAFRNGARSESIQRLGNWRSEAYTRYLCTPAGARDVTHTMVYNT